MRRIDAGIYELREELIDLREARCSTLRDIMTDGRSAFRHIDECESCNGITKQILYLWGLSGGAEQ